MIKLCDLSLFFDSFIISIGTFFQHLSEVYNNNISFFLLFFLWFQKSYVLYTSWKNKMWCDIWPNSKYDYFRNFSRNLCRFTISVQRCFSILILFKPQTCSRIFFFCLFSNLFQKSFIHVLYMYMYNIFQKSARVCIEFSTLSERNLAWRRFSLVSSFLLLFILVLFKSGCSHHQ